MIKFVYLSNFFNHHQKFLSDNLYKALGANYWFVETAEVPEAKKKLGYHVYQEPYLIRYNDNTKDEIDQLIIDADVVQFGEAPVRLIKKRVRAGKLVFRDDERRYKSLIKYLKWPIYTYNSLFLNKGYLLGASAFAARDYVLSGMRLNHCYKWGYFTEFRHYEDIDSLFENKRIYREQEKVDVTLLWAARIIDWKHPETVISVAKALKRKGVSFLINVIGTGNLEEQIRNYISEENLNDSVRMLGPMSPEEVRSYMEKSDVFLATSDQNEGWGAAMNESMNSGCTVIAGHMIGAVPFLVKDGINGIIFRNKDWNDLAQKVCNIVYDKNRMEQLGREAYMTIHDFWNPEVAACNLLVLSESLIKGEALTIAEGPCSRAAFLTENWINRKIQR